MQKFKYKVNVKQPITVMGQRLDLEEAKYCFGRERFEINERVLGENL
jgi:hypothetical protein